MGIIVIMGHFGSLGILQRTCGHGSTVGAAFFGHPRNGRDLSSGKAIHRICARRAVLNGIRLVRVDAPTHRAGVNLRAPLDVAVPERQMAPDV